MDEWELTQKDSALWVELTDVNRSESVAPGPDKIHCESMQKTTNFALRGRCSLQIDMYMYRVDFTANNSMGIGEVSKNARTTDLIKAMKKTARYQWRGKTLWVFQATGSLFCSICLLYLWIQLGRCRADLKYQVSILQTFLDNLQTSEKRPGQIAPENEARGLGYRALHNIFQINEGDTIKYAEGSVFADIHVSDPIRISEWEEPFSSRDLDVSIQSRNKRSGNTLCRTCISDQDFQRFLNSNDQHPTSHLIPAPDYEDQTLSIGRDIPILWTSRSRPSGVAHNTIFNINIFTGQLELKTSGYFYLFLQITLNGRESRGTTSHVHCGYVTWLKRANHSRKTRLMLNMKTQEARGRPFGIDSDGNSIYAIDGSFQAGIFRLKSGDQISVVPDNHSRQCRINFYPDKTYFGAIKIAPP